MNRISRSEAMIMGETRYFTGNACPRGHISERMVSTRGCCECIKLKRAIHRAEHKDVNAESSRMYRARNPDKVRAWKSANQRKHREAANARNRRYADKNRDMVRSRNRIWAINNPGSVTAKAARRRAAVILRTPKWFSPDEVNVVYAQASDLRRSGHDVHVDHIVPLQGRDVCGLHVQGNLQIISSDANRRKTNNF